MLKASARPREAAPRGEGVVLGTWRLSVFFWGGLLGFSTDGTG